MKRTIKNNSGAVIPSPPDRVSSQGSASINFKNPDGTFKKGNRFWEARSSHGTNPKFKSPNQLWTACCEYFQWVDENPLYEEKQFAYMGDVSTHEAPKMRAMTISGLCIFLNITDPTWQSYKKRSSDFLSVCTAVEKVIWNQKFAGASAGLLNHAIIARELGLAEKMDHSSKDGSMTPQPSVVVLPAKDKIEE